MTSVSVRSFDPSDSWPSLMFCRVGIARGGSCSGGARGVAEDEGREERDGQPHTHHTHAVTRIRRSAIEENMERVGN